jgi:hypothetical protein
MGGWATIIAVKDFKMSKFKIFSEDILEGYNSHLKVIYKVDGVAMAKEYLESIIRAANKCPELYRELLPAIMELPIVKKIRKEVGTNGEHTRGEG